MTMTRAPPGAAKAASPRRPSPQKPCGDGWTGGSPCNRYRTRRRGTTITSCGQTFAIRSYPAQRKKANEQALARKGGKGWISSDSKCHADNMKRHEHAEAEWRRHRARVLGAYSLHGEVARGDAAARVPRRDGARGRHPHAEGAQCLERPLPGRGEAPPT